MSRGSPVCYNPSKTIERWTPEEKQKALEEAYNIKSLKKEINQTHPLASNIKIVVFTSRREYGHPRKSPKTAISPNIKETQTKVLSTQWQQR